MRIGFSQTAEHCMNRIVSTDYFYNLPNVIYRHTYLNYTCKQTDHGYFLEPTFRKMPYANSFVPEIDIVISQNNGQTILNLTGRPVKFVRIFTMYWFGCLALMELLLLIFAAIFDLSYLLFGLFPVILCLFAYLFCKIATKLTFQKVLKAIQKGF